MAHQQTIPVQLDLKRQLIIEKDQLINYFDTTIAIQDDVLLHSLEEDASPYMKDITTTIQQEQNQIIRDETRPLLLVNGLPVVGKRLRLCNGLLIYFINIEQKLQRIIFYYFHQIQHLLIIFLKFYRI